MKIFLKRKIQIYLCSTNKSSYMGNADYISIWIGGKIKDIRKTQNLTLGELAQKSGISIAMLSKIENGRVFPTLPSLLQIFDALELDLNNFFSDYSKGDDFKGYIFKKRNTYTGIEKEEDSRGFDYETILSYTLEKSSMEISLLTLAKDARRKRLSTEGFEYIYLIKGNIDYELGKETFHMEEGDSLFFDGRIDHVPLNKNDEDSVLLVIYFITLS
ncbi:XRE family transcriptional regulator [Fulvivirgaceae bacterium BMA12]|uniref:XRE family transcriptional regulator n=1 Tax=Agaribacillus aureus TaxID=3051825 RepID=A0ABT8LE11_9BACT|nr:XRE family transcriptional regulator [Fulvivirgaceae bacterium BMA12]